MNWLTSITFLFYFLALATVIFFSYHKQKSDTQFILGNRSLNYWLTALSAQASDMSSWLFMAYPAAIFAGGLFNAWIAIGIVALAFLNWHIIAPKLRTETEKYNCLTLNCFFEKRFNDTSGMLRLLSSFLTLLFFSVYISAGLTSLGYIVETLFGLSYFVGITLGLFLVAIYVVLGGYVTVAWIDLFQGLFLLAVILIVPTYILIHLNGLPPIFDTMHTLKKSTSLFPDFSALTISSIIYLTLEWGLGYFGQPHILTKFMGIQKVEEMGKAKLIGVSWQSLTLIAATLIGIIGIHLFPNGLTNPELITLEIVKSTLHPIFAALIICAIIAATTNVIAAQVLVVASSLSEDLYTKLVNKNATHHQLLRASRLSVILVALIAYLIAYFKISTIYKLVLYAWSGLGASFGPLLLLSLYSKKVNKYGAFTGIFTGGIVSALWPLLPSHIPSIVAAFIINFFAITVVSTATSKLTHE